MARSLGYLGALHAAQQDPDRARLRYQESLALGLELGDRRTIAACLEGLAIFGVGAREAELDSHPLPFPTPHSPLPGRSRLRACSGARRCCASRSARPGRRSSASSTERSVAAARAALGAAAFAAAGGRAEAVAGRGGPDGARAARLSGRLGSAARPALLGRFPPTPAGCVMGRPGLATPASASRAPVSHQGPVAAAPPGGGAARVRPDGVGHEFALPAPRSTTPAGGLGRGPAAGASGGAAASGPVPATSSSVAPCSLPAANSGKCRRRRGRRRGSRSERFARKRRPFRTGRLPPIMGGPGQHALFEKAARGWARSLSRLILHLSNLPRQLRPSKRSRPWTRARILASATLRFSIQKPQSGWT